MLGGARRRGAGAIADRRRVRGLPATADADLRKAIADRSRRAARSRLRQARRRRRTTRSRALDPTTGADAASPPPPPLAVDLTRSARRIPDGHGADDRRAARDAIVAAAGRPSGRHVRPQARMAPSDEFVNGDAARSATLAGRPELPVLPIVAALAAARCCARDRGSTATGSRSSPPCAPARAARSAPARFRRGPTGPPASPRPTGPTDPWHPLGPVVVAYGPGVASGGQRVAIAALDGWTDSVPSRAARHHRRLRIQRAEVPRAACGPARRAAGSRRSASTTPGLLDVVLETRELAHARAPRPSRPEPDAALCRRPTAFVQRDGGRATSSTGGRHERTRSTSALEPGRTDTDEGLRARVADPVWFLTPPVAARRAAGRRRLDPGRGRPRRRSTSRSPTTAPAPTSIPP